MKKQPPSEPAIKSERIVELNSADSRLMFVMFAESPRAGATVSNDARLGILSLTRSKERARPRLRRRSLQGRNEK
jgi:hypothetical protein